MHVMNRENNVENMGVQELNECEQQSKNIVICGIEGKSIETSTSLIKEFFNIHCDMLNMSMNKTR